MATEPGTPLPWFVDDMGCIRGTMEDSPDISCGVLSEEDALYLLTACNAYPALLARVERLEGALRELEAAVERKWSLEFETVTRRSNALSPRIEEALMNARLALAEAQP